MQFELLGYGFVSTYEKGVKGQYQLVVGRQGVADLEAKGKGHYAQDRSATA